jgi:hypothetical protein
MYNSAATAGVFPSKPLNMAGNPVQPRPASAVFPTGPGSPRLASSQVSILRASVSAE